jgi:polynucleotide 5'-hydroxyl-kinase GRC3/NOL9
VSRDPRLEAGACWAPALGAVREVRITLVLGESDTGKTTLVVFLANALLAEGASVAIVDADLGQSEIGPPTTVGLGRPRAPLERLADAEVAGLCFVGATSPRDHVAETVLATRRLTDRALGLGADRVLVDTSGLVHGEVGRALKQAKIDLVGPDLVLCLQRDGECEPILRPYAGDRTPAVVRLDPAPTARRRSAEERRRHRERSMAAYFVSASPVTLDLGRVVLRAPPLYAGTPLTLHETEVLASQLDDAVVWAERRGRELAVVTPGRMQESQLQRLALAYPDVTLVHHALADFQDAVVGLDDERRETLGLGVVRGVDFIKRTLVVETPVEERAVAAVRLGRLRLGSLSIVESAGRDWPGATSPDGAV